MLAVAAHLGLALLAVSCAFCIATAQVNVSLLDTASQIVYSPPACNSTTSGQSCGSAWQIIPSPDDAGSTVTSTYGPTNTSGELIPQLFLSFRGTTLYIETSSLSNASTNVTLIAPDPTTAIVSEINTGTVGEPITVVDLPEDRITTLVLTFVPSKGPTRLDVGSFLITVPNDTTSPFVSTSLPPSMMLSTFVPTATSSSTHTTSQNSKAGDIAAEVLGSVLGAVLVGLGIAVLLYSRTRWRRKTDQQTGK